MIIQWYGQGFVRVESRGTVLAIDPFSKKDEWGITKVPRFRADAVLVSHDHADHNNVAAIEGSPLVFRGPGEYETKGIFIQGHTSFHDESGGRERGLNTIFTLDAEEMRLCHMGDIGTRKLPEAVLESLGNVDVLFIPVGGVYTVDARGAWGLISAIEPKIAVPIHYKIPGLKLPLDGVEKFLKEAVDTSDPMERLSIRKKEIPTDGIKVQVLKPLAFTL
jgi:L-ascorbate metabolism protein UlaG (beta-lactamase superfamily)